MLPSTVLVWVVNIPDSSQIPPVNTTRAALHSRTLRLIIPCDLLSRWRVSVGSLRREELSGIEWKTMQWLSDGRPSGVALLISETRRTRGILSFGGAEQHSSRKVEVRRTLCQFCNFLLRWLNATCSSLLLQVNCLFNKFYYNTNIIICLPTMYLGPFMQSEYHIFTTICLLPYMGLQL